MKRFFVLLLAVIMALTLTACGGDKENGGAKPGGLEEETGDSGGVEDEPEIVEGEWYFIEGEFYHIANLGDFFTSFKEYEATYSDPSTPNSSLQSKYLGDDKIGRHFSLIFETEGEKAEMEMWVSETGELVQVGARVEGEYYSTKDPEELAGMDEGFSDHYLPVFVMRATDDFKALFTDPEVFARDIAEHGYVINNVSAQKRDFGTGKVTVIHYEYSGQDDLHCVYELAKIGGKYLLVYGKETLYEGRSYERTVTRAVPFKK